MTLPLLPLAEWEATKDTLHLVGADRRQGADGLFAATKPLVARNSLRRRTRVDDGTDPHPNRRTFRIDFDFVDHRLVVGTSGGAVESFPLEGLSVAGFDQRLHATLAQLGIDVAISEVPFGIPVTTPFPDDTEHASYDPEAVERFFLALSWTRWVFEEFAGWYCGKTSPVQVFWHSFDLAVSRFSGKRAPAMPDADRVTQEAYSHEVISFGFWAGDQRVREPTYYSYTAPEPKQLREQPLAPAAARWLEQDGGSLAVLPYDAVRTATDPKATLLTFLESAYQAGATAAGWNTADLASSWCPTPSGRG